MKIINDILRDLDGQPILERSANPQIEPITMTVASTLRYVALQPPPEGQTYTAKQTTVRLEAAIECHRAWGGKCMVISSEAVKEFLRDVPRFFAPLVAGQLIAVLEGGEIPIKGPTEASDSDVSPENRVVGRGELQRAAQSPGVRLPDETSRY